MDSKLLKRRPAIELYEVAAVTVLITALDANYPGPLANNEYVAAQFWESALSHKNREVLTVIWKRLIRIIQKTNSPMLYDLGFMTAIKCLDKPVDDPDLQDAMFEFMFYAIEEIEKDVDYTQYTFSTDEEKNSMCMHIFEKLSEQLTMQTFYPRGEFLKLFGETFGYLLKNYKV